MFNKIKRHDDDPAFKKIFFKARELTNDPIKQLKYVKENGNSQIYLMALVEIVQDVAIKSPGELEVTCTQLDLLFRGFTDAVRHMQDLPEGVYDTILGNIESISTLFIEEMVQNKNKSSGG